MDRVVTIFAKAMTTLPMRIPRTASTKPDKIVQSRDTHALIRDAQNLTLGILVSDFTKETLILTRYHTFNVSTVVLGSSKKVT